MKRLALLLAFACLAPRAAADDQRGLALVRQAQAAMQEGDNEQALELLRQARTEWPDAPLVANTMADALRELGRYDEALVEYQRGQIAPLDVRDGLGQADELRHHAQFNSGVTRHLKAEQALEEAGVPPDVGALPEGPQPEMLQAIESSSVELAKATDDFLTALRPQPDDPARESIEALGRRSEALAAMAEELRKRQEQERQKDDQKQDQKDQGDDKQQQDQQQQQEQDQEQQQQQQQQQDQQQPQDQQPQDQPQPQDQQQEPKPDEKPQDQQPQDEQQPQTGQDQPPKGEAKELSPEEVQQLLDKLDKLEQQARELQKAREAVRRRPVEKDW